MRKKLAALLAVLMFPLIAVTAAEASDPPVFLGINEFGNLDCQAGSVGWFGAPGSQYLLKIGATPDSTDYFQGTVTTNNSEIVTDVAEFADEMWLTLVYKYPGEAWTGMSKKVGGCTPSIFWPLRPYETLPCGEVEINFDLPPNKSGSNFYRIGFGSNNHSKRFQWHNHLQPIWQGDTYVAPANSFPKWGQWVWVTAEVNTHAGIVMAQIPMKAPAFGACN